MKIILSASKKLLTAGKVIHPEPMDATDLVVVWLANTSI
jgi:hypothetical protein